MRLAIILLLLRTILAFQPHVFLRKPTALQLAPAECMATQVPSIWQTTSDLAVISTVCSAGIFVMIPFWYFGMQFSEAACRKIDDFFMYLRVRNVEKRIKKLDK